MQSGDREWINLLSKAVIPYHGEVTPSGNKNAALPLLAACLLTDEPIILHNLPEIRDVQTMRDLLSSLGVNIKSLGNHSWRLQAKSVRPADLDPDLCKGIRASILLAGPMVARAGELLLPPPGGDVIGRRRVDTHILAIRTLGAHAEYDRPNKTFNFKASHLIGADILLDEASVTATENAIMAAVTARGTTTLVTQPPNLTSRSCVTFSMGLALRSKILDPTPSTFTVSQNCMAENFGLDRIISKWSALLALQSLLMVLYVYIKQVLNISA